MFYQERRYAYQNLCLNFESAECMSEMCIFEKKKTFVNKTKKLNIYHIELMYGLWDCVVTIHFAHPHPHFSAFCYYYYKFTKYTLVICIFFPASSLVDKKCWLASSFEYFTNDCSRLPLIIIRMKKKFMPSSDVKIIFKI